MTRPTLIDRDRASVWHPYTQMLTAPPPLPIVRGEGVYLYTEDGRRLLDGISSWWVNIHGHAHPRLNTALAAQAGPPRADTHPAARALAQWIGLDAPPGDERLAGARIRRADRRWSEDAQGNLVRRLGSGRPRRVRTIVARIRPSSTMRRRSGCTR